MKETFPRHEQVLQSSALLAPRRPAARSAQQNRAKLAQSRRRLARNPLASSGGSTGLTAPDTAAPELEKMTNLTAARATQWRSNPVSGASLPKTGIFRVAAGDFRQTGLAFGELGSLETVHQTAKARQLWAFLLVGELVSPTPQLLGWGGRIRTSVWWIQNP
jgi:hypothetical protein